MTLKSEWRVRGVAVGVSEACAGVHRGDVDVLGFGQAGASLVDVGLGELDAWAGLQGEVDGGGERDLRVKRSCGSAEGGGEENEGGG